MGSKQEAYFNEVMSKQWYVIINDIIGGFAIATKNCSISELQNEPIGLEIVDFISENIAKHIVFLHNMLLSNVAIVAKEKDVSNDIIINS